MAGKKISELTEVQTLKGTEYLVLQDGNSNAKVKLDKLKPGEAEGGYIRGLAESLGAVWHSESKAQDGSKGAYWLNGLTDITVKQMELILTESIPYRILENDFSAWLYNDSKIRTNIILGSNKHSFINPFDCNDMFAGSLIEVAFLDKQPISEGLGGFAVRNCKVMFYNCPKLRKIIGKLGVSRADKLKDSGAFSRCPLLEDLSLWELNSDVCFPDSPKLSKYSLDTMVRQAHNTKEITIQLHPDVFAKVSSQDAEWGDVYTLANTPAGDRKAIIHFSI